MLLFFAPPRLCAALLIVMVWLTATINAFAQELPQVPVAGAAWIEPTGYEPPDPHFHWDIIAPDGTPLASNVTTNGWDVLVPTRTPDHLYPSLIRVTAPASAVPNSGYLVRATLFQNLVGINSDTDELFAPDAPVANGVSSLPRPQQNGISARFAVVTQVTRSGPPVSYVAAYATGAASIRVYWQPDENAIAYKIFRSTTSGSYDLSQPLTTVGAASSWYDDTNLIAGQEYFYTVQALRLTGDSLLSEENSHTPSVNAIPWNGTADAIVDAAWQEILSQPALDSVARVNVRVMAPDGIIYSGESHTALPPDGRLDPATATEIMDDGIPTSVGPDMFPAQAQQVRGPQAHADNLKLGGIRKVVSTEKDANGTLFTGVNGTFYLPPASANMIISQTPNIYAMPRVSPHAYVGIKAGDIEIDAGINFENALPQGSPIFDANGVQTGVLSEALPVRWNATLRVHDHKPDPNNGYANHPFDPVRSYRVMGQKAGKKYIWADAPLGNSVKIGCTINRQQRLVSLSLRASDGLQSEFGVAFVAAANFTLDTTERGTNPPVTLPLKKVYFKRILSLDQSRPAGTNYTHFDNQVFIRNRANQLVPSPEVQPGWIPDGSFMENFYWSNGALWTGSVGQPWTTNLVRDYTGDTQDPSYNKNPYYYRSDPVTKLFANGSLGLGDPANERIDIHH